MLLLVLFMTACAGQVRDTRYMASKQMPELKIPAGLDTPNYNKRMRVPDVAIQQGSSGFGAENNPDGGDTHLDRPPRLDTHE